MKEHVFLVEIGTEPLPYKILKKLGQDFFCGVVLNLKKNRLLYKEAVWFASSCRLAVKAKIIFKKNLNINNFNKNHLNKIFANEYSQRVFKNPKIISDINMKDDTTNVVNTNLEEFVTSPEEVEVLYKNLQHLLYATVNNALKQLNNYKMMRWGSINTAFIRPVRTVTILLDSYIIPGCFFGIDIDRILYGNINMVEQYKIVLEHAKDYPDVLIKSGWVIADYFKRKEMIKIAIEKEVKKLGGIVRSQDKDSILLDEVTSLVEWPVILYGKFNKKFLALPSEVILHIMRYDQKYFPVFSITQNDVLLPYFIFVANTVNNNYKNIVTRHEYVMDTRLIDAKFFWENDRKYRLEDYVSKLSSVLFHRKLGTLCDKSHRIEYLSAWIAGVIGIDVQKAKRAGYLCKGDLMSHMVCEFPSTQGIIGMHYAYRDGESSEIVLAQKEHYQPRFSMDRLPTIYTACVVSVADKMDTISGIFGIQELPKGNRDPFALKRLAVGILRILIYRKFPLNLSILIQESVKLYQEKLTNLTVIEDINNFMYKRLFFWYSTKGYRTDIIKAVLKVNSVDLIDVDRRLVAVSTFFTIQKEKSVILNVMYKRISNIILDKEIPCDMQIQYSLLKQAEEICLVNQLDMVERKMQVLCSQYRYYDALVDSVKIFDAVNKFFDKVIIINKNKHIQMNRLLLLNKIKSLFLKIIDISLLST
ncbi:glycine--tRNA ligase subunit beta [Candidatus Blochmannia ocreatus (nom. nud.)]|uniref:Glycine--tRNA ligase beta subunit n=1 Tax=Candidatus Blochmannia ocreatus (nom. nud.) TaxID=251538 RepID=A0ABY4ST16_9ENTR|nr:glycine--tRNA ligase subunit beta [Candidatus Blochmannia ocreatus]URJ25115.1 glycine--tRNA ligase subunit beta [Candidatus Blochmannia ocreatus]